MSIFSLNRRSSRNQAAIFEIQSAAISIPLSSVVAREPWSGSGLHVSAANAATGYTSYSGRLVPVYDMSSLLGLAERRIGSEEVAIIATSQGYVAIQIDGFSDDQGGREDVRQMSADDLLKLLIKTDTDS